MKPSSEAKRLRIYISSTDKFRYSPLYEVIVYAAKRYGLAGATVFKGVMGYGSSSEVHSNKLWELSEKLPVVVEIVDESDKVLKFYDTVKPYFEKIKKGYLITIEDINVVEHKTGKRI
jgi:uncharacterized protein